MIFHELFNTIVFQFRVCSVEYFMDKMTKWEINDIIDNIPYLDRNLWETCRLNSYFIVRCNSTKNDIKITDILKFKWEDESKDIEISTEDIKRLREKAKRIKLNGI